MFTTHADAKLAKWLDKIGQKGNLLRPTDFGRGRRGYTVFLFGGSKALGQLQLIDRGDGTWRLHIEPALWLKEGIEKAGFPIATRTKPQRKRVMDAPHVVKIAGDEQQVTLVPEGQVARDERA